MNMEKQYTVKFFSSFVDNLQELCRTSFQFDQAVEVSGYICVEIDNSKKERYVLSEVIHNHGNVVSESFCHKAFKTSSKNTSIQSKFPPKLFDKENKINERSSFSGNKYRSRDESMSQSRQEPAGNSIMGRSSFPQRPSETEQHTSMSYLQSLKHGIKEEKRSHQHLQSNSKLPSFAEMAGDIPNPKIARLSSLSATDWSGIVPSVTHLLPHNSPGSSHSLSGDGPSKNAHLFNRMPERRNSNVSKAMILGHDNDQVIEIDLDELEDDASNQANSISSNTNIRYPSQRHTGPERPKTDRFIQANIRYAMNLMKQFLEVRDEKRPVHAIPPPELDTYLAEFYIAVRKSNGDEFQPTSFKTVQNHIDRYLRENSYPYSITKDAIFERSQDAFRKKRDQLIQSGSTITKGSYIRHGDVDMFFENKQLGGGSPDSLINTMWFMNSAFFGMTSEVDHHNLTWGDVLLGRDPTGRDCLTYACPSHANKILTIYGQPETPSRCFLVFYKEYMAARPPGTLNAQDPFYLTPNPAYNTQDPEDSMELFVPLRIPIERLTNVVQLMMKEHSSKSVREPSDASNGPSCSVPDIVEEPSYPVKHEHHLNTQIDSCSRQESFNSADGMDDDQSLHNSQEGFNEILALSQSLES